MPQMMPMMWLYILMYTFILLMFLITMMYYLSAPTFPPINHKLSMLIWSWKW